MALIEKRICDACGTEIKGNYGVTLKTDLPRPTADEGRPTHEIDLCHKCACKALQTAIDISLTIAGGSNRDRYTYLMTKLFPTVKRIDS